VVAGREGVALHFNDTSKFNESWLHPANQKKWKYTADHDDDGAYALDAAG
jgi:hypothetical protein